MVHFTGGLLVCVLTVVFILTIPLTHYMEITVSQCGVTVIYRMSCLSSCGWVKYTHCYFLIKTLRLEDCVLAWNAQNLPFTESLHHERCRTFNQRRTRRVILTQTHLSQPNLQQTESIKSDRVWGPSIAWVGGQAVCGVVEFQKLNLIPNEYISVSRTCKLIHTNKAVTSTASQLCQCCQTSIRLI